LTNRAKDSSCIVGTNASSEDAQWLITPESSGSKSLVIKSVKDLAHFSVWCEKGPEVGKSWGYCTKDDKYAADGWTVE